MYNFVLSHLKHFIVAYCLKIPVSIKTYKLYTEKILFLSIGYNLNSDLSVSVVSCHREKKMKTRNKKISAHSTKLS